MYCSLVKSSADGVSSFFLLRITLVALFYFNEFMVVRTITIISPYIATII